MAEATIQESEARFRLFVTASSDTLYKMSADWSEMRSLQGMDFLADTDHPSSSWLEKYIPEDDRDSVVSSIQDAIRSKSSFKMEHRVMRADGSVGWTFSHAIPLLDESGAIVEWFGAASDITERKQAQATIRDTEDELATLRKQSRGE
jgi:PAS domain-containing protein